MNRFFLGMALLTLPLAAADREGTVVLGIDVTECIFHLAHESDMQFPLGPQTAEIHYSVRAGTQKIRSYGNVPESLGPPAAWDNTEPQAFAPGTGESLGYFDVHLVWIDGRLKMRLHTLVDPNEGIPAEAKHFFGLQRHAACDRYFDVEFLEGRDWEDILAGRRVKMRLLVEDVEGGTTHTPEDMSASWLGVIRKIVEMEYPDQETQIDHSTQITPRGEGYLEVHGKKAIFDQGAFGVVMRYQVTVRPKEK